MSRLSEAFASKKKVITAEITPPKGAGIKKFLKRAEILRPCVDALNITDCQRALVRMSSLVASKILLDHGIEPVFQLTCRDRNAIALQSDLMGAGALGIPNLLCLTGDPVKVGDCPDAKSVFEMEALGLLELTGKLQTGQDRHGHKMNAPTKFYIGAVVNPSLTIGQGQMERMGKKAALGAKFFQTQANYDLDDFAAFLKEARRFQTPVVAGVLLLHSAEMAQYIHDNIPGIRLPDALLERLKSAPNQEQAGIDFAAETMLKLDPYCEGFHLMSIRAEELIPRILETYHERK